MIFTKALIYIKKNISSEKEWKVYPTLVYDHIMISTPKKSSAYFIEIKKNNGKTVFEQNLKGEQKINFKKWEKGVYIIYLKYDEGEFQTKLLFNP